MNLNEIIDNHAAEMIGSLKELLRIPSAAGKAEPGAPYGRSVADALDYMLKKGEEFGFRTENCEGQAGILEYGEGEEMIAVVAHLDVVPAGEGWSVPAYDGTEKDGFIFGRGSVDDKGPAVTALYALLAIKESGLKINKRIRLMFGTNEENGSTDMKYFFEHGGEHPSAGFTPDGAYPVICGEKGILITRMRRTYDQTGAKARLISIHGGTAFNVVPAKASAEIECEETLFDQLSGNCPETISLERTANGFRAEAAGISAHGSTPEKGVNAIAGLIAFLKDLPFAKEAAECFRFLDEKIGSETDGKSLGIALCDERSGGLVLNLGTIEGDESALTVCVNYRYPVTFCYEDCAPAFNRIFEENGFTLISEVHENVLYVDPEGELVSTLLEVYNEYTGRNDEPICIGGGTYAKSVPNIVAFGPVFPGEPDREHKPDECVEIDKLILNAKICAEAMYRLAK